MSSGEDDEEYLLLILFPNWLLTKWSLGLTGTIEKIPIKEIICGVEALVLRLYLEWAWESLFCLAVMDRIQRFLS